MLVDLAKLANATNYILTKFFQIATALALVLKQMATQNMHVCLVLQASAVKLNPLACN